MQFRYGSSNSRVSLCSLERVPGPPLTLQETWVDYCHTLRDDFLSRRFQPPPCATNPHTATRRELCRHTMVCVSQKTTMKTCGTFSKLGLSQNTSEDSQLVPILSCASALASYPVLCCLQGGKHRGCLEEGGIVSSSRKLENGEAFHFLVSTAGQSMHSADKRDSPENGCTARRRLFSGKP